MSNKAKEIATTIIMIIITMALVLIALSVTEIAVKSIEDNPQYSRYNVFVWTVNANKQLQQKETETNYRVSKGIVINNNLINTEDGNLWEIDTDNTTEGQSVFVVFDTHNTQTVIDDTIEGVYTR